MAVFFREDRDGIAAPVSHTIPNVTGYTLPVETIIDLSSTSGIVGVKDSSGEPNRAGAIRTGAPDDFLIMIGSSWTIATGRQQGAHGAITASSNYATRLVQRVVDGEPGAQELLTPLVAHVEPNGVPGTKVAAELTGLRVGALRRPLLPVDPEIARDIAGAVGELARPVEAQQPPAGQRGGSGFGKSNPAASVPTDACRNPERTSGARRRVAAPRPPCGHTRRTGGMWWSRPAGPAAGFPDTDYEAGGATVSIRRGPRGRRRPPGGPPHAGGGRTLPRGAVLCGFLDPFVDADLVRTLADGRRHRASPWRRSPAPRWPRAWTRSRRRPRRPATTPCSSPRRRTPKLFPMMITAAGTIPPVKVLVLGAGVAGLQAIATARRLGAVVSAYDIRPETKEQIESLGAKFVAAPDRQSADEGGLRQGGRRRDATPQQHDVLTPFVADADVVITTAQIPGRPAPLLVTREMVAVDEPGLGDRRHRGRRRAATASDPRPTRIVHAAVSDHRPDRSRRPGADRRQPDVRPQPRRFLERITDEERRLVIDLDDEIVGGRASPTTARSSTPGPPVLGHRPRTPGDERLFIAGITVFVLAAFVGFEVISKVPPTLHTPLMSGANAISGITIVGAITAAGVRRRHHGHDPRLPRRRRRRRSTSSVASSSPTGCSRCSSASRRETGPP